MKIIMKAIAILFVSTLLSLIINYILYSTSGYVINQSTKAKSNNLNLNIYMVKKINIQDIKPVDVENKSVIKEHNNTIKQVTKNYVNKKELKFLEIFGIFTNDSKKIVFIKDKKNAKNYYLEENDSLLVTYKIHKIYSNEVEILNAQSQILTLRLKGDKRQQHSTNFNNVGAANSAELSDRNIRYSTLDEYIKSPSKILSQISFQQKNGKFYVNSVKTGSFVYNLGIRKGDLFKFINGEELNETLLINLYRKINDISEVHLTIERNGIEKNIEYKITRE